MRSTTSLLWWALTLASTAGYVGLLYLSRQFDYDAPTDTRPLLAFYGLMGLLFGVYLVAMIASRRTPSLFWPVTGAVVFRAVLIFSTPIQEVDIYRYLWDGAVLAAGENPFRYPPQQITEAAENGVPPSRARRGDVQRLVELQDSSPGLPGLTGLRRALLRIHYPGLTTIYPPVSQMVFAAAASTTPGNASLRARVRVMKAWLVGFDLATLVLVIAILRAVAIPPAMCVAYGWCPLVLKEIANSGHLDAIAVFFVTLACWLQTRTSVWSKLGAAVSLALGVGAKLFPVVLIPWLLLWTWRERPRWALLQGVLCILVSAAVMSPMLLTTRASVTPDAPDKNPPATSTLPTPSTPDEEGTLGTTANKSEPAPSGLAVFLKHWEMNDFLFMLVLENLRPTEALPPTRRAWFSVVPESWRMLAVSPVAVALGVDRDRAAFLVTRAVTAAVFCCIALWLLWHASRETAAATQTAAQHLIWLRTAFLLLAWFLLLSPTINPWYWTWTMPLLALARSPAWRLASGLLVTYYLRFYCDYQLDSQPVAGTPYIGVHFFDYVLVWAEHLPLMLALLWASSAPPSADAPSADAPSADAPSADAPSADAPSADAPSADAPSADATEGRTA